MNKIIVTYDKSNEDIPTLVVGREDGYSLLGGVSLRIEKVITGQKAEDIWEDLTGEKARREKLEKSYKDLIKGFNEESEPCTAATEED